MKPNSYATGHVPVMLPPPVDPGCLPDDIRALLNLFNRLTESHLEFTRVQFELWPHQDEGGPQRIAALRQPTSQKDPRVPDTPTWQLTGEVVRWDFEQENWAWRTPLLRFYGFDELATWLHERFAPGPA